MGTIGSVATSHSDSLTFEKSMNVDNTVVILGNGFDLDLGWKTSFKDFLTSEKFCIYGNPRYPVKYMSELFQSIEENWYNLEEFMRECVEKSTEEETDALNLFWNICRDKIYDYLTPKGDQYKQVFNTNINSCAYLFLQRMNKSKVFSFNYTLPYDITHLPEHEITYLHGALNHGLSWIDIKLGIDLHVKNKLAWSDKLKPYLKAYESKKIDELLVAIKHANKIIIYGHSLGITDSDYFEPIFSNIIHGPLLNKSIFFITKNSASMQCIKDNMSKYGIDYNRLVFGSSVCKNIYTDNGINNPDFQNIITNI